ncbi:hypothetical protein ILUMI_22053 [Ignelater luminosus]|uniref:Endonuclease/exonuclease/phosphatase domain-containing protein n=1 Tax=Ignelater luminosus TaxID=2038154 RepID=A0A8K0CDF7_IGNLU|nr:hypothetical protein ILUMI_22053 [Ignelater luminosus]
MMLCMPLSDDVVYLGDCNVDFLMVDNPGTEYFNNMLDSLNLHQIIIEPTRLSINRNSLIDIVVTSNLSLIKQSNVLHCDLSDHELLRCDTLSLEDIFYENDIEQKILILVGRLKTLFDKHAPWQQLTITRKPTPWLTDNVKLLITLRDKAKDRFKRTKSAAA